MSPAPRLHRLDTTLRKPTGRRGRGHPLHYAYARKSDTEKHHQSPNDILVTAADHRIRIYETQDRHVLRNDGLEVLGKVAPPRVGRLRGRGVRGVTDHAYEIRDFARHLNNE